MQRPVDYVIQSSSLLLFDFIFFIVFLFLFLLLFAVLARSSFSFASFFLCASSCWRLCFTSPSDASREYDLPTHHHMERYYWAQQ